MWRYFRKRRALRAYRTTLFKQLRKTYGRKLFYTTEEVTTAIRDVRASTEFSCFALGMFCDREAFDAHHAARGETCEYAAIRSEVFAHAAHVTPGPTALHTFDGGCDSHDGHHGHDGHHDGGWFASGGHDSGHHGGGDFGGGHGGHH